MTLQLYFPKPGELKFPFFSIPVAAGLPQPIEQIVEWINLDEYVRSGMDYSYYIQVRGDSMEGLGIFNGDLLVVQRQQNAETGDIVIAEINGEFTVKIFEQVSGGLYLVPANNKYKKKKIKRRDQFSVWGVVTYIIHKAK